MKDTGILGLQKRGIQSGTKDKAGLLRALYNEMLLKYKKIEKTSDIGIRRGQKEYPPASLQLDVIYSPAVC